MFGLDFFIGLGKIVWIDVLLSGDNALVIAMACHALPARQRLWGMILGAAGAVALRILLTGTVTSLMELPYLKLIGGLGLVYVATKMLVPDDDGDAEQKSAERLWVAVRTIVLADIVMSIDNVIAVAAAAHGDIILLALALMLSIPLVVGGAAVISEFLSRFPILVWMGAGLLGWIAGETVATDPVIAVHLKAPFDQPWFYAAFGACVVPLAGTIWRAAIEDKENEQPT
jgi:YjbE family integral membrane protein